MLRVKIKKILTGHVYVHLDSDDKDIGTMTDSILSCIAEEVGLRDEALKKIVLFIRTSAFLPENDKLAELNKLIIAEIREILK